MKAGIITHFDVHNHGANLQMYALIQQLGELGYNAKALKFQKNYDFMGGAQIAAKYNISIKSIPIYVKYLLNHGLFCTIFNFKKRNILSRFRKDYNLVGKYYSEAEDVDLVVIGSDEIFSVEAGPNPWYYGIGIPCNNQISYAASFGPTTVEMIEKHNVSALVRAGLENIRTISVRDQNSADIVKHYTDKNVPIVCDPVLLYSFEKFYSSEIKTSFRKIHYERYCIVYSYDYNMNDEETISSIKDYAKDHNLKIYSVGYYHKWCDININLSPLDIFKWFACAEMVFTDTFHGTVISLVTESQFVSMIRGNGNKLEFLLNQYGVADRRVSSFTDSSRVTVNPIDYSVVAKKKREIQDESLRYLAMAVCSKK